MKRLLLMLCVFWSLCAGVSASSFPAVLQENEDGFLTVYFHEQGDRQVTHVPVTALPKADAERIRQGIPLPDQSAYARAMEDFCS